MTEARAGEFKKMMLYEMPSLQRDVMQFRAAIVVIHHVFFVFLLLPFCYG